MTAKDLTRSQLYTLFSKIGYGYLIKNYSKNFVDRCKKRIKVVFVEQLKGVIHIHCAYTGNEFMLTVNLSKNTIEHRGCYAKNKNYPSDRLILDNISQII